MSKSKSKVSNSEVSIRFIFIYFVLGGGRGGTTVGRGTTVVGGYLSHAFIRDPSVEPNQHRLQGYSARQGNAIH